jgi:hypothetical protein
MIYNPLSKEKKMEVAENEAEKTGAKNKFNFFNKI